MTVLQLNALALMATDTKLANKYKYKHYISDRYILIYCSIDKVMHYVTLPRHFLGLVSLRKPHVTSTTLLTPYTFSATNNNRQVLSQLAETRSNILQYFY